MADPQRFIPLQRALHWLMALLILSMLLPLIVTHRTLGVAILILALFRLGGALALRRDAPALHTAHQSP
jgi:cytochrome b561